VFICVHLWLILLVPELLQAVGGHLGFPVARKDALPVHGPGPSGGLGGLEIA
jgi:hypothetical protein